MSKIPTSISELKWNPSASEIFGGHRAIISFENGYTASVLTGGMSYHTATEPYEVAVLLNGVVNYDHGIEGNTDVFGYCTEERALHIIKLISQLPHHTTTTK